MAHRTLARCGPFVHLKTVTVTALAALTILLMAWPAPPFRTRATARPAAPQNCPTCPEPVQQVIYAATIGLPGERPGQIVFNNRSPLAKTATPTFYTSDGTPVVGRDVELEPAEIRFLDIESLIPEEHRDAHQWGGMSLSYLGRNREVWAQLMLDGVGKRGSVDVLFTVLGEPLSDTQESVWWMPKRGSAILALGNSSGQPLTTTLEFADGETREVKVAPFGTEYVHRVGRAAGPQGGAPESVRLTAAGAPGALRPAGAILSPDHKFASGLRFYSPQGAIQSDLFATNLRLKNNDTHLVLRNTSDGGVTSRLRFLPPAGEQGEPVELPAVSLEPRQVLEVDLRPLAAARRGRSDMDSVGVQVTSSGPPGSLIGALYSIDKRAGTVYDVPLRDTGPLRNLTGAYPWRVDGDYSTVVTVTNVGQEAAEFTVNIFYRGGGRYVLDPRALAPGETATFDLKRMRDERIPDRDGNTIPEAVSVGQFRWSVTGDNGPTAKLTGRSEVVSASGGVSSSYSCPSCCPNSFLDGAFSPTSVSFPFTGNAPITTTKRERDCYNNIYGPYNAWWTWTGSSPSGILSVSQTATGQATVSGQSPGSASFFGYVSGPTYFDNGQGYCYQSTGYTSSSGSGQVRPTVTITGVSFSTNPIPQDGCNACTRIRVQLSASTGVPANTTVELEAFQDTNPNGVTVTIAPTNGRLNAPVTAGQVVVSDDFLLSTPGSGNARGPVGYRVRILTVNAPNNVVVDAMPAGGAGVASSPPLCVGGTLGGTPPTCTTP